MSYRLTEAQFLKDIAKHDMIVIRDEGSNRHIRFKQPGTNNAYFDLITWPGHLCYTGDMGTYVFQRLTDMFAFFRTSSVEGGDADTLHINVEYWTEKLIAVDGNRGGGKVKAFVEDKFKRVINEYRVQWMRDAKATGALDKDSRRQLWEAVDDEVLYRLADGADRAELAAYDFCYNPHPKKEHGWQFEELFEHDFTEFTTSIRWCCYALAWGIKKYDASKVTAIPEGAAA